MILFTLLTACDEVVKMCTEMYMESGLSIELEGEFAPGAYRFEADDGETQVSCELELPITDGEEWVYCDDDWGSRVELADADTPSTLRLSEFMPEAVDVTIFLDDVELASESLSGIEYSETEYNGEGCDYAYNATVTMAF
ncbi:MAG: hypothetical protein GY913_30610 [Proteobacteria bacterium]|nr:hypothetical protein [Pseudomonadota bacterium]MCP4921270.1 hypothetical protein [Pseudomonadota bacterium]